MEITDGEWSSDAAYGVVHRLAGDGYVKRGIIHVVEDNYPRFAYDKRNERDDNECIQL